jgi:hypothetical protein
MVKINSVIFAKPIYHNQQQQQQPNSFSYSLLLATIEWTNESGLFRRRGLSVECGVLSVVYFIYYLWYLPVKHYFVQMYCTIKGFETDQGRTKIPYWGSCFWVCL